MIQKLKRNWVVASKLTWGIWWFLTQALERIFKKPKISKILILMCSFWANYILFELKLYRGVIFHDNEEEYKTWREIDLSFQNWHEEFDEFWPEHLKASKIFTLMRSFWAKYILFELKNYRGVIFHDTEEWCKIWRRTD